MTRLKHKALSKLSELTGYNKKYLCDIVATRKRFGPKRAQRMAKITGIEYNVWREGTSEQLKRELNKMRVNK